MMARFDREEISRRGEKRKGSDNESSWKFERGRGRERERDGGQQRRWPDLDG